ncbi:MlaD family protein [Nocardioides fonticola]|uniref:MlaD family protein n=2 Tax=Nocardioides fonticola TaxID=450363 RepID=A0ABP7XZC1_9ACTN
MKPLMKPLNTRDPFRVGLVALLALVLLGVGVVVLSRVQFGATTYTAILQHTAGLRVGESVEVAGVPVGKVTGIELREDDVEVTFTLDDAIDLGTTTTAAVKVATLLGTHYLEVHPRGSGSLADDQIPLAQTSVPYNLQDVLDQGTQTLEDLDPVKLADALTAVSNTLERSGDDVGPALEGIGRLSQVVAKRSDQTAQLLQAAEGVSKLLADDSDDIVELMKQTTLVLSEITQRREAIHNLLVRTRTLSEALSGIVTDAEGDLKPALADLDTSLVSLRREDDELKNLLTVMAPAVRYLTNASGNGPFLDLYVQGPVLPTDDQKCRLGNC